MSLPEISRRCLSCGAAARAGARFCPQCGKLMEEEAEAARADDEASPASAGEAADVRPAAVEEIRLEESWKRWEESVVAPSGAAEVEAPAQSREAVGGESREVAGEVSTPPSTPPLMRPQATPRPAAVAPREGRADGQGNADAPADSGAAAAPLARPRADERGRRAAAVKESLRPRVERVRDASMGVLEDAAEDSGLRFVLIALVLFAVFLVFLFINNLVR